MAQIIAYSGIVRLTRKDLEKLKAEGERVHIRMAGVLVVARDVPPRLAAETIGKVDMRGFVHAAKEVKTILAAKQ